MHKVKICAVASPVLALLLCSQLAMADTITGKVVSIADGDTITILDSQNQQHRIRLAQIDAPETAHGKNKPTQSFGERSKQSVAEMVFGKMVRADCTQKDRYKRSVCTVIANGRDVNLEQVRRGFAWVYAKYAHDPAYFQAENEARSAMRGLWIEANPIPPWEWRRK